jgi:hypothetical protein
MNISSNAAYNMKKEAIRSPNSISNWKEGKKTTNDVNSRQETIEVYFSPSKPKEPRSITKASYSPKNNVIVVIDEDDDALLRTKSGATMTPYNSSFSQLSVIDLSAED